MLIVCVSNICSLILLFLSLVWSRCACLGTGADTLRAVTRWKSISCPNWSSCEMKTHDRCSQWCFRDAVDSAGSVTPSILDYLWVHNPKCEVTVLHQYVYLPSHLWFTWVESPNFHCSYTFLGVRISCIKRESLRLLCRAECLLQVFLNELFILINLGKKKCSSPQMISCTTFASSLIEITSCRNTER